MAITVTPAKHDVPAPSLSSPRLITYFWALRALKIRASTIQNRQAMDPRDPKECLSTSL